MVARRNRKYERLGSRYSVLLLAVLFLILFSVAISVWQRLRPRGLSRETIAVWGDPVTVWSWDTSRNTIVRIEIPANAYVAAVEKYGTYSLDSLWVLGTIEKRDGELFAQSLEETLGIPIPWYIGYNTPSEGSDTGSGSMPIHLGSVWAYARGTFTTNIPLSLFLAIAWRNSLGRLQPVAAFDIGNRALSAGTLPDGTSIQIIDADRWDQLAANTFEDDLLRKEALPIAIYNTTARPALGNRVARILGHLGAHVVSVGNDEVIPERCIVAASKKLETSSTVRVIQSVLDCEYRTLEGQERADVVVRLGIGYE